MMLLGDGVSVRWFLEQNANPAARVMKGRTALHYAAQADDSSAVRSLLRAGTSVLAPDRNGDTPWMFAARLLSCSFAVMIRHFTPQWRQTVPAASVSDG